MPAATTAAAAAAAAAATARCQQQQPQLASAVGVPAMRRVAAAVLLARGWALRLLQPLAQSTAAPLARFREAKKLGDARQLGALLRVQAHRTALRDAFFVATSFAGNADFYLLLLPTMIWQGAPELGRKITYMVTSSLVLGNTLKDIVALPRPPSPPVWRPTSALALDSSAFADFGWPSTHAMNAVTNPLLVAAALAPWWRRSRRRQAVVVVASLLWASTISFGRLYLGAHSRSDVFGGHLLGALVAAFWVPLVPRFDAAVTAAGAAGAWMIGGAVSLSVALFTLYPAQLLAGASAPQSAELVGLFLGCMVGSRQEAARVRRAAAAIDHEQGGHSHSVESTRPTPTKAGSRARDTVQLLASTPRRAAITREALGYAIALSCRELTSTTAAYLIRSGFHFRGDVAEGLGLILRKVATYFVIAWTMAGVSPAVFRWLGIHHNHTITAGH